MPRLLAAAACLGWRNPQRTGRHEPDARDLHPDRHRHHPGDRQRPAALRFAADTAPGQTNGEGIKALGGVWHVAAAFSSFLGSLPTVNLPGHSTVPGNGDVNPYGVAVVPRSIGRLVKGDILVSNFNNKAEPPGDGHDDRPAEPLGSRATSSRPITPAAGGGPVPGRRRPHHRPRACSRSGWVIVGSLPTKDGTPATARAGLPHRPQRQSGESVETFHGGPVNGPWDMTALDGGSTARLFVTNVLNGTVKAKGATVRSGTVVRLVLRTTGVPMPQVVSETVIGSRFGERTDPAALAEPRANDGLAHHLGHWNARRPEDKPDDRPAAHGGALGLDGAVEDVRHEEFGRSPRRQVRSCPTDR